MTRREAMYSFLFASGTLSCMLYGGIGAKDLNLPITIGPQAPPTLGPRGKK